MEQYRGPDPDKIQSMFQKVAHRYDAANTTLSFGIHHLWRKRAVKAARVEPGDAILDCATGTGDLAIAMKKATGPAGRVIGTDFCQEMLAPAPQKAEEQGMDIVFEQADVTNLPYEADHFDVTSISFGIRNVGDPKKGLRELYRVTKPGGRVVILEFGKMDFPVIGPLYQVYSQNILPRIGGLVTGEKQAYDYLQKSSAQFPCRDDFVQWMHETGKYEDIQLEPLSFGIAYLYVGRKAAT